MLRLSGVRFTQLLPKDVEGEGGLLKPRPLRIASPKHALLRQVFCRFRLVLCGVNSLPQIMQSLEIG